MKKISIVLSMLLLLAINGFSQVAINKDGSQPDANSILHVKGDAAQKNVILEPGVDGKVGIGTTTPTATLDVEGDIKINDGSQGNNKVLVSNPDGRASWKKITDVSAGLMSPSFPNGLDGIIPKTIAVNSSTSFQVPNKVTFYILNVFSDHDNNLEIDGYPVTYGRYNYSDGTHSAEHLTQPLLVGTGSVLSGSDANDIVLNGYLVGNGAGGGNPAWACGDLLVDDHDGQAYSTVQIGNQCWMAQNLNAGTMINGSNDQTNNNTIEKYCYNDDASNCNTYGGLYQWNEAMQYVTTAGTQGICPTGWHIPTDDEWKTLEMYLGMSQADADATGYRGTDEGGKLKETGTTHWASPNTGATNSSGFTALPGGYRHTNGSFSALSNLAYFWSSSEVGTAALSRFLSHNNARAYRDTHDKDFGFSLRCVRD